MPPIDWLNNLPWHGVIVLLTAELTLVLIGAGLIYAIIKVRHEPVPSMLLVTLGLLTLVCILGFALTRYQVLGTLAAAGMGAIAGSLTNVLHAPGSPKPPLQPPPPTDVEDGPKT